MLFVDQNSVIVKNYSKILILENSYIEILLNDTYLCIQGEKFIMQYYDEYEIRIIGYVKVIEYHEYRV